ncbi:MAG TPA: hypothetical protein VNX21_05930 [Candidatus Thermoplasmatota archaeon]|nr:hypothetical protein [Candidatus Thermoplasmatota archaeon]
MTNRGYEELTDKENADILATRTPRFWRTGSVYQNRSRVLSLDFDPTSMRRRLEEWGKSAPGDLLLKDAVRASGSIGGRQREDLKEAIIGAPSERPSLSVNVGGEPKAEASPKQKRGF